MIVLSKEQINEILQKLKVFYSGYENLIIAKEEDSSYIDVCKNSKIISKCYCKLNNGKLIEDEYCKYCGNRRGYNILFKKSDIKRINELEERVSWNLRERSDSCVLENFYYVCKNPEEEFGILVLKIKLSTKILENSDFEDTMKIEKIIYINSNKESKAYKISRGKEVEMDLFDAFNLNSKTADNDVKIVWENCNGMLDFLLKNKDLCKRFGVLECFNNADTRMPRNAFFMFYMYLYCKYPAIELLVKMDNNKLVSDIMGDLSQGYNKESIRNRSKELDKLLNKNATKGSLALRIPRYISDYLSYKDADINEFLTWCDLYEMENFSKEQFEEVIEDSFYYIIASRFNFSTFLNVMRYGYTYKKLTKYIEKQAKGESYRYSEYLRLLDDYRNMMNIMEIEAEEFPGNLKGAHDNAVKAYKAAANELNDKALKQIADKLDKVKEIESDDYIITIPKCVADFVQEGNKQHNCVSSYVKKVINKDCIIFFIRKKEDPEESFVTAEFSHGRLYQIMYKNNVRVWEQSVLNFANSFCNKIKGMHLIN